MEEKKVRGIFIFRVKLIYMEFLGQEKQVIEDKVIKDIQELLEKNHDAEKGFLTAESASSNMQLKKFLKKQAGHKRQYVNELSELLKAIEVEPRETGSTAGMVHRTWMDFKTALASNKDETVLKECIKGEQKSEKEYLEKLQNNNLPSGISDILRRHLAEIRITIAQVSSLGDLADHQALGY